MICKNCQKFVTHEWFECPNCGYLNNSEDLEKLIAEYKEHLIQKDYIKCRIILEKCLKFTKFSSKEEIIRRQLEKINFIIKKSGKLESTHFKDVKQNPGGSYIRDQMLFKSGDDEDRIAGKKRYIRQNNIFIIFVIFFTIILIGYNYIFYEERTKDIVAVNDYIPAQQKKITPELNLPGYIDSNSNQEIVQGSVGIMPHRGTIKIDGNVIADGIEIKGINHEINTDSKSSGFIKFDNCYCYLDEKTNLLIESVTHKENKISTKLNLKKGSVYFNVKKLSKADVFEVKTSTTVAGVKGTKFQISFSNDLSSIKCLTGKIEVKDNFGKIIELLSDYGVDVSQKSGASIPAKLNNAIKKELQNIDKLVITKEKNLPFIDENNYELNLQEKKSKTESVTNDNPQAIENPISKQQNINFIKNFPSNLSNDKSGLTAKKTEESKLEKTTENTFNTGNLRTTEGDTKQISKPDEDNSMMKFVKSKYSEKYTDSADSQFLKDKENINRHGLEKTKKEIGQQDFYKNIINTSTDKFGKDAVKSEMEKLKK